MLDPKLFYRKMVHVLGDITEGHRDKNFLPRILNVLLESFGEELFIGCGHLFEEKGENWKLIAHSGDRPTLEESFPVNSITTDLVVQNGGYIFDKPEESPELYADRITANAIPAAFVITLFPAKRWMFVYCLLPGWNRDEIEFMLNGIRSALNNRMRSEVVLSDLEKAVEIQRSLLPSKPPLFEGFEIAAKMKPAASTGGDFYDFLDLDDEIMGIAVGDASGHGLPAALLVRDVIMGIRMGTGTHLKMLYTLKKLNRELHRTTFSTRFISVFYAELEKNGDLLYANAGHAPGLIFDGDTVHELEPTGMILGAVADVHLNRSFAHIPAGGILVLFTDGVTERVTNENEPLETKGLVRIVREHRHQSAAELVDTIFRIAETMPHESQLLEDDMTVLVVKRNA